MALPVITYPVSRQILTQSTAYTVAITSVGDTTVSLYSNGSLVGAMTNAGGGSWTYSWTPATVATSNSLTAVGDVNGTSAAIIITVAETNAITNVMTGWSTSGVTVTLNAGITHPLGSGNVYEVKPSASGTASRFFYKTASPTPTYVANGMEIWVGLKSGSTTNILSLNNTAANVFYDFSSGQNTASNMYSTVVETRIVNGVTWQRFQVNRISTAAGAQATMYHYLCNDLQSNSNNILAGDLAGAGIYVCEPRWVGTTYLPFTAPEKIACYKDAAASTALAITNAEQWWYKHPYVDSETNMAGGPGGIGIRVVKPSGWTNSGTYPCILFLKAQTDSAETTGGNKTAWQTATIDDYANTYGAIVLVVDERPSEGYWAGVMSTGNKNMADFYPNVLIPWAKRMLGISSARNDHIILGYSKAGNAAVMQILLYPSVWGFAGSWDGAFLNIYPGNNSSINYDTAGIYNAHDPAQILVSNLSSVNDKKRLSIRGGHTWGADYTSFTSLLTANNVKYDSAYSDPGLHAWGPTGTNGSWTPTLVSSLFSLRAAANVTGSYRGLMFF